MELLERLREMLEAQLGLYQEIESIQLKLQRCLDDSNQLKGFTELLAQKNALLDAVHAENIRAMPLLDIWENRKQECQDEPGFQVIQDLNAKLIEMVIRQRNQDELMLKRFAGQAGASATVEDKQNHSRNMLNAFRALR